MFGLRTKVITVIWSWRGLEQVHKELSHALETMLWSPSNKTKLFPVATTQILLIQKPLLKKWINDKRLKFISKVILSWRANLETSGLMNFHLLIILKIQNEVNLLQNDLTKVFFFFNHTAQQHEHRKTSSMKWSWFLLPCICPISSQDHTAPSDLQGKCVCSSHTSSSTPLSLHETLDKHKNSSVRNKAEFSNCGRHPTNNQLFIFWKFHFVLSRNPQHILLRD